MSSRLSPFVSYHLFLLYLALSAVIATDPPRVFPLATKFRAFGPLPYIAERASDPLQSFHTPLLTTLSTLTIFPSESAVGGSASWRACSFNQTSAVVTCPFADADSSLPYQVWAVANFTVNQDVAHSLLLQCSDPTIITLVEPHPDFSNRSKHANSASTDCPEDTYDDGRSLCVLRLYPGTYSAYVRTASDRNFTQFKCNYVRDPNTHDPNPLLKIQDSVTPDIVYNRHSSTAKLAGNHLSITLQNIHTTNWATVGTVSLIDPPHGLTLAPHTTSDLHFPLPRIAPRQIRQLRVDLLTNSSFLNPHSSPPPIVNLSLVVSYNIEPQLKYDAYFNLTLSVVVWREARAYHFTYLDVDSSVQTAAVLPPKFQCNTTTISSENPEAYCNVLLSTHGAGVDAIASAWTDSYETQSRSWVLLPTGRRKFGLNWEGPQMKSAITALRVFSEQLPGIPQDEKKLWQVRPDMWLQAGHSMGGHGALLLATHFPDMLVAALPAMGWLRLGSYGGLSYPEQQSFSDAASRSLLMLSSAEYSADLYAENLLGIPFLARVGSEDDNVPPSRLRKFCRLLKENEYFSNYTTSFVRLSEVKGKGHWFGGVVDDDVLQKFIGEHLSNRKKPDLPLQFSLFTMNPASSGSRGGLAILQLEIPFEVSRLTVRREGEVGVEQLWRITTENVRRFRYRPVYGILQRPARIIIDENEETIKISASSLHSSRKHVDFCSQTPHTILSRDSKGLIWRVCRDSEWGTDGTMERGPDNSGPAFQVLCERKLVIVYPEGDGELLRTAVSYSNSLYLSGISSQVTPDSDVSVQQLSGNDNFNVVLLGGPNINRMAARLYSKGFSADVTFADSGFCVAHKCFQGPGTGIAFLSNAPGRKLAFYIAGTDRSGLQAALSLLPHSPSSNVPEWMIVSREKGWGWKGLGGVLGLGYWDHEWKLEYRKMYPSEWMTESGVCMTRNSGSLERNRSVEALALAVALLAVFVGWALFRKRGGVRYEQLGSSEGNGVGSNGNVRHTEEKVPLKLVTGM